ncbi:MAG: 3-dehydroquinate synthase [Gammaproteobacteria bacterium]|nr:3-dehydroquinate synthase [Gammaproteobacteria bacterium]
MITVKVELGARSYPILIGLGLLADKNLLSSVIPGKQVMVVTNEVVAPLYEKFLRTGLTNRDYRVVTLADGEQYKTLVSFERIMTALLEARYERSATIVALGGGVVGDIAGFAAASYQRGIKFIQIPTTLLAQVDSSVGGKTAVNHPLGKNMIGAFYQPQAVIADLGTLETLPDRELKAGLAEVIKYGLLGDRVFLDWIEANLDALVARDSTTLIYAIERSCRVKAAIVMADENESGQRALLNLGHTFGHAIEHALGYGVWLHGEAVAAGMCMAARLSCRLKLITHADCARVIHLITRAGLPSAPPVEVSAEALLEAMRVDKKNKDGQIRLVLFDALGATRLHDDYATSALYAVLHGEQCGVTA